MIIIMVMVRTVAVGGSAKVSGADFIPWMIVGLFGFQLFRENMMRSIGAIDANKALFAYRQVKPIDTIFIRCYLEGLLKTFIFILFILAGSLVDVDLIPVEPLVALFNWLSIWLLGLGVGSVLSAVSSLIPEVGRIVRLVSFPLLIISGVLFPLNIIPHNLQQYLMLNPIAHGLELLRVDFFSSYRPVPGVSATYLWFWILPLNSLGLMLNLKFQMRLKAQ